MFKLLKLFWNKLIYLIMRTSTKKIYYKSGSLKEVRIFKDGLKHGKWIYYYKNGNIHYYKSYKNGKLEGERKSFYEDGKISFTGSFENNEKKGKWIYFDLDGSIIKEDFFLKLFKFPIVFLKIN